MVYHIVGTDIAGLPNVRTIKAGLILGLFRRYSRVICWVTSGLLVTVYGRSLLVVILLVYFIVVYVHYMGSLTACLDYFHDWLFYTR